MPGGITGAQCRVWMPPPHLTHPPTPTPGPERSQELWWGDPEGQLTPVMPGLGPLPTPRSRAGASPADVLGVRGKGDRPLGDTELRAAGGRLGLAFAPEALTLAGVEVFEDAARKEEQTWRWPRHPGHRAHAQSEGRRRGAPGPLLFQRVARLAVTTAHGEDLASSSGPRGEPGVTPASASGSRGSPAQVRTLSGRCTPGPRLLPAPSSPPAAQEAGAVDAPRGRARASLSSLLPTLTPRAPPDCHLDPRRLHAPHSCLSTPPFPRAPPGSGLAAGDFSRCAVPAERAGKGHLCGRLRPPPQA